MSEEPWEKDEDMAEESAELYGNSEIEATLYACDECGLQSLAQDVHWSRDGRALCPRCEWPLDRVRSDEV